MNRPNKTKLLLGTAIIILLISLPIGKNLIYAPPPGNPSSVDKHVLPTPKIDFSNSTDNVLGTYNQTFTPFPNFDANAILSTYLTLANTTARTVTNTVTFTTGRTSSTTVSTVTTTYTFTDSIISILVTYTDLLGKVNTITMSTAQEPSLITNYVVANILVKQGTPMTVYTIGSYSGFYSLSFSVQEISHS